MRKNTLTLLVFSAAIALLLSSPLLLSNILLQPVQAANEPMTFRTNTDGGFYLGNFLGGTCLTFEGHGTNAPNSQPMTGWFEFKNWSSNTEVCGDTVFSGNIYAGIYSPNYYGSGESVLLNGNITNGWGLDEHIGIRVTCDSSYDNNYPTIVHFQSTNQHRWYPEAQSYTECILGGGSASTQASSNSSGTGTTTTTTAQDSDGDGIPDSSDKCTHNSNPRCFKENASTQQPSSSSSSSSNGTGNQTKG